MAIHKLTVPPERTPQEERERLLLARAEILEVLRRHELVAYIAAAGQYGRVEGIAQFEAPWFKAEFYAPEGERHPRAMRMRSKLADYAGDEKHKREDLESTLGALASIAMMLGGMSMCLLEFSAEANAALGAEQTPLRPDDETPGFQ